MRKKRKLPNIRSIFHHNYVNNERINISFYRRNVEDPPLSLKNLLEEYRNELLVEKDYREELLLQLGAIYIVWKYTEVTPNGVILFTEQGILLSI